jgi:cyclophilin family peptidyl-prolyl cis-trans isomerase/protein-disulfide isomerase
MRRRFIALLVLLSAVLAACGGAGVPVPTAIPATSAPTEVAPIVATPNTPESSTAQAQATPVPTPDIEKIVNPQPEDWQIGSKDAKVTFIEWADFQCPYCAAVAPLLQRLIKEYPNDVQLIYRQFPLDSHPKSVVAAEATEAAGAQGKFWEMEGLLFDKQPDWTDLSDEDFRKTLSQYAQQIGLDVKKFDSELDAGTYQAKVIAAQEFAVQIGLPGTPFLLVNQQPWPQSLPFTSYNNLSGIVKLLVDLPKQEFKAAPAMQLDQTKAYTATVKTDQGDIILKLYADKAPVAVNNFVFLAKQGWYDNVPFHRVVADFVAQAGDPSGLGFGGPGYTFDNEVTGLKFDKAGILAMANAGTGQDGKGTNGSQFFITLAAAPQLDAADPTKEANYTIFGEVIGGMDVLNKLAVRDPQNAPDIDPSLIKTITIDEQ